MTEAEFGRLSGPFQAAKAGKAAKLVVLLHGYGANGDDLFGLAEPLIEGLGRDDVAVWAPNAPDPLPGVEGGLAPMRAYQWFPIVEIDRAQMAQDIQAVRPQVQEALGAAVTELGLAYSDLILIGFSQGGMVAMEAGLTLESPLGAIVGLSTAYLGVGREAEIKSRAPITLVHGDADPVVPPSALRDSVQGLLKAGIDPDAYMIPNLQHGIDANAFQITLRAVAAAIGD